MKTFSLVYGIILVLLTGMMLYLRQSPSEAMWFAYDPLYTEPLSFRLSLKPSSIPHPLFDGPTDFPVWSPDGQWIAFLSDGSIYRASVRHSHVAHAQRLYVPPPPPQLSIVNTIDYLVWSPDGHQLAFTLNGAIFTINATGSDIHQLTDTALGSNHHLSWSPDSQSLAFIRLGQIFRVDADGSDLQQLAHLEGYSILSVAWSPDGEWIAFGSNDIFKVRPDGSDLRQLTHTEQHPFHEPVWSPDSKWLVVFSVTGVFRLRSDGTELYQLSTNNVWRPSWSPDGRWIAFETFAIDGNNITVMHPDGSQRRELINSSLLQSNENFSPSGSHFAWSPIIDLPYNGTQLLACGLFVPLFLIGLSRFRHESSADVS